MRLTPSGSLRSPPTPFRGGQGRYGICLCASGAARQKKGGDGPAGPVGYVEGLRLLRARAFPPPTGHPERSEGSRYMEIVAPLPIHTGRRERFRENDFLRCSGWMGPADNEYICRLRLTPSGSLRSPPTPFRGGQGRYGICLCASGAARQKKRGGGPTGPAGCAEGLLLLRARAFPPPTGHPERSEGSRYMEIVVPLPIHTGRRERFRENDFLRCSGWMGPAGAEIKNSTTGAKKKCTVRIPSALPPPAYYYLR